MSESAAGELCLKLNNLSLNYGSVPILQNLSYEFKAGRSLICGCNGSGKTTLLNIIAGQLKEYTGQVESGSEDRIAYCRQFMADAFFSSTVAKEIEYTIYYANSELKSDEVWQQLESLGLHQAVLADKSPFQLSLTEQKLLSFILAIIKPFDILLLDETDSGLSFGSKQKLADFLRCFSDKIVIVISHDLWFISYLQAPVLCLQTGGLSAKYADGNAYLHSLGVSKEEFELITRKDQIIKKLQNFQETPINDNHSPMA